MSGKWTKPPRARKHRPQRRANAGYWRDGTWRKSASAVKWVLMGLLLWSSHYWIQHMANLGETLFSCESVDWLIHKDLAPPSGYKRTLLAELLELIVKRDTCLYSSGHWPSRRGHQSSRAAPRQGFHGDSAERRDEGQRHNGALRRRERVSERTNELTNELTNERSGHVTEPMLTDECWLQTQLTQHQKTETASVRDRRKHRWVQRYY